MKKIIPYLLLLAGVFAVLVAILLGCLHFLKHFIQFEYTSRFAPLWLILHVFIGIGLVIPLDIVFSTVLKYKKSHRSLFVLSEIIQLILIAGYLKAIVSITGILKFKSIGSEIITYLLMYGFIYGMSLFGSYVDKKEGN